MAPTAFPLVNAIVGGFMGLVMAWLLWLLVAAPFGLVWTVPGMTGNRALDFLFLVYFLASVAAGATWSWREAQRHPTMAHGRAATRQGEDHDER